MYKNVIYELRDGIGVLIINRPKVLNALSKATRAEIGDVLDKADRDSEVGALIITGAGGNFSAGQDLSETADFKGEDAKSWIEEYERFYGAIRNFSKPLIAAVDGWAVGAAFQVVLQTDIVIASPGAKFAMLEIEENIPCITGTALLWPVVGRSRTIQLILTGKRLTAKEAERWGIVSKVVPANGLLEEAKQIANALAVKVPVAIREDKRWFNIITQELLDKALKHAKEAHTRGFETGQPQKAMQRFKR